LTEEREDKENEKKEWLSKHGKSGLVRSKATLIVCPASLISQWEGEVKKRLKSGVMSTLVYHGNNRGQSARSLARNDLVITTYGTVMSELKAVIAKKEGAKLEDLRAEDLEKQERKL